MIKQEFVTGLIGAVSINNIVKQAPNRLIIRKAASVEMSSDGLIGRYRASGYQKTDFHPCALYQIFSLAFSD